MIHILGDSGSHICMGSYMSSQAPLGKTPNKKTRVGTNLEGILNDLPKGFFLDCKKTMVIFKVKESVSSHSFVLMSSYCESGTFPAPRISQDQRWVLKWLIKTYTWVRSQIINREATQLGWSDDQWSDQREGGFGTSVPEGVWGPWEGYPHCMVLTGYKLPI